MSSKSSPYRSASTGQPALLSGLDGPIELAGARIGRLCERICIGLIGGYRLFVSPLLGPRCRFHPSCSVYAQQSIARFGIVRGGWLAVRRLSRCGPWHPGGLDEVPGVGRNEIDDATYTALSNKAASKAQLCCPHGHGKDL